MSKDLQRKGERLRELHEADGCFVVANAWDGGSAAILETLGFEAIATTSAGFAFSLGRADGRGAVSREAMLENARAIAAATSLPVTADLENGWADDAAGVAETIRLAGQTGIVGGSIEDSTPAARGPIYELAEAVERVRAAVEAARALPFPFALTARAENYLHGRPDLADTIRRLQAYAEAGADVVYAPGLSSMEDVRAVVGAVDRPVNVVMGLGGFDATVADLAAAGVRRISVGSAFARAAVGEMRRAAAEVLEKGTFTFKTRAASHAELNALFSR